MPFEVMFFAFSVKEIDVNMQRSRERERKGGREGEREGLANNAVQLLEFLHTFF